MLPHPRMIEPWGDGGIYFDIELMGGFCRSKRFVALVTGRRRVARGADEIQRRQRDRSGRGKRASGVFFFVFWGVRYLDVMVCVCAW